MRKVVFAVAVLVGLVGLTGVSFSQEMADMNMVVGGSEQKVVAIDGLCAVCLLKGEAVMGSPDFSVDYQGKTYNFAGEEQKKAFLENPEMYVAGLEEKYKAMQDAQTEAAETIEAVEKVEADMGTAVEQAEQVEVPAAEVQGGAAEQNSGGY